jgi:hypothetical protein
MGGDRRRDQLVAIGCAAIASAAGLVATFAAQDGAIRPSALVKISNLDPIAGYARAADPHFRLVNLVQHYDGTYYYAIARDPFLKGRAHTLIDEPAYRYGHPLHGWLAGVLSLGQARAVPAALFALSLIGMALAGWAVSRLAVQFGRTPWAGLVVAVSPGVLYSVTVDTTEALGVALLAMTLLAWTERRYLLATLLIVLICLDKEQYVTVPLGLAIWELVQAHRRRAFPDRAWIKTLAVVTGPLVLTGWYLYVRSQLHQWPWTYGSGNIGAPFAGWRETLRLASTITNGSFEQAQIGNLTPVVLIAIAVVLAVATVVALRVRSIVDLPFLGMVVITSMQGWRTLLYPHELFRTTAITVLFAIAVLAISPGSRDVRRRAADPPVESPPCLEPP